jgi:hypothetical protein
VGFDERLSDWRRRKGIRKHSNGGLGGVNDFDDQSGTSTAG